MGALAAQGELGARADNGLHEIIQDAILQIRGACLWTDDIGQTISENGRKTFDKAMIVLVVRLERPWELTGAEMAAGD